jgi:hypothetical protein
MDFFTYVGDWTLNLLITCQLSFLLSYEA